MPPKSQNMNFGSAEGLCWASIALLLQALPAALALGTPVRVVVKRALAAPPDLARATWLDYTWARGGGLPVWIARGAGTFDNVSRTYRGAWAASRRPSHASSKQTKSTQRRRRSWGPCEHRPCRREDAKACAGQGRSALVDAAVRIGCR